jgi:hypothetical protein
MSESRGCVMIPNPLVFSLTWTTRCSGEFGTNRPSNTTAALTPETREAGLLTTSTARHYPDPSLSEAHGGTAMTLGSDKPLLVLPFDRASVRPPTPRI